MRPVKVPGQHEVVLLDCPFLKTVYRHVDRVSSHDDTYLLIAMFYIVPDETFRRARTDNIRSLLHLPTIAT